MEMQHSIWYNVWFNMLFSYSLEYSFNISAYVGWLGQGNLNSITKAVTTNTSL